MKLKNLILVFLVETKAGKNRIRGIQNKLDYTQGITVPRDNRSGGLSLLWKEGTNVRFKSCSNSHIDIVVYEGAEAELWRETSFYGDPDSGKRHIS